MQGMNNQVYNKEIQNTIQSESQYSEWRKFGI